MNFTHINDIDEPQLQIYHQFREHAFKADGSFVADSPKVVNLLIEEDVEVESILATKEYYDAHTSLLKKIKDATFYVASKNKCKILLGTKYTTT